MRGRYAHVAALALLAVILSSAMFFRDGDVGINLADEGYLWYGMRAFKAGQIPIRDFQAYDPGRYVWTAAWSTVFGEGLVSMRFACVLFQCVGMTCGLLAARRASREPLYLVVIAVVFIQWMIPTYKVFEQSIALMAVWVGVLLLEQPSRARHFGAGLFVGFAAFMGRNHGLYNLLAFGLIIIFAARGNWWSLPLRFVFWGGGIAVGYMPQLLMFAFVPGYFDAFLALLQRNVAIGSNLSTQVPWPWTARWQYGPIIGGSDFIEGLFYLALPVAIVVAFGCLLWRLRRPIAENPLLVASSCVVLAYAHHTFSRADYVHLAHSAPVLALVIVALVSTWRPAPAVPRTAAIAFCAATFPATFVHTDLFAEMSAPAGSFVTRQVLGEKMHVSRYHDVLLTLAEQVAGERATPDEAILFLPHWPGLYAATSRKSPLKQIYFIRPASSAEEDRTLAAVESANVRWVILQDYKLDGREDLRFRNTNPLVFRYFTEHFDAVPFPRVPRDTVVLRRR